MLSRMNNKPSKLNVTPTQSLSSISSTVTTKTSILVFEILRISEEKKSKPTGNKSSIKSTPDAVETNEVYDCLMDEDGTRVSIVNGSLCPRSCALQCLFQYLVDGREENVYEGYDKFAGDHFKSVVFVLTLLIWAVNCTTHRYPGDLIAYGFSRHRVSD